MRSALRTLVGQRLSVRDVGLWVLFAGTVYALTGDIELIAAATSAYLFAGAMDLLRDVPTVDERWFKAGVAVLTLGVSSLWLAVEVSSSATVGDRWLPALAVVASAWLVLDARADFVQRVKRTDQFEQMDTAEFLLAMQHGRLVADELRDGPMTVPELAAACDLTASRVETAIEVFGTDGTVHPVDPDPETDQQRYALDEERVGVSGVGRLAAGGVSGLLKRLYRPFVEQF
jgi:hypothetical protein